MNVFSGHRIDPLHIKEEDIVSMLFYHAYFMMQVKLI